MHVSQRQLAAGSWQGGSGSIHTLGIVPQVRPPEDDISQPADEALRGVDASRSHSLVSLGSDAATAASAAGAAPSFASSNATIVLRSEPSAAAAGRARSSISSSGIFEFRSFTNLDYEVECSCVSCLTESVVMRHLGLAAHLLLLISPSSVEVF